MSQADRTARRAGATSSRPIHTLPAPADERRVKENTFARDTAVTLAVLGGEALFKTSGRVLESSGDRVLIATPAPLTPGTPVSVEGNDTLLLGEVYSVDHGENEWIATVKIAHSLASLAALGRFNRALLGERTQPALIPSLGSPSK
jgi:hypothetical protein